MYHLILNGYRAEHLVAASPSSSAVQLSSAHQTTTSCIRHPSLLFKSKIQGTSLIILSFTHHINFISECFQLHPKAQSESMHFLHHVLSGIPAVFLFQHFIPPLKNCSNQSHLLKYISDIITLYSKSVTDFTLYIGSKS